MSNHEIKTNVGLEFLLTRYFKFDGSHVLFVFTVLLSSLLYNFMNNAVEDISRKSVDELTPLMDPLRTRELDGQPERSVRPKKPPTENSEVPLSYCQMFKQEPIF